MAVLPGVYTENIVLKPFVSLKSAAPISTDANLLPGNPLKTTLRAPASDGTSQNITLAAQNFGNVTGFESEVTGFSISSPLLGDPALGVIDPESTGVDISNSSRACSTGTTSSTPTRRSTSSRRGPTPRRPRSSTT